MYVGVPSTRPVVGEPLAAGLVERPRDAEVGDPHAAVVQQDVLRLDVAVHHAGGVGMRQRRRHLPGHRTASSIGSWGSSSSRSRRERPLMQGMV